MFIRTNSRAHCILATLLLTSALMTDAYAHHSPAGFDMSKTVTVKGVLSKVYWANPHVYIYIEETTDKGAKIEWEIECFPPLVLRRMGWDKNTLRVGEPLSISGSPARNLSSKELFPSVIKRGESTLFTMQEAIKGFSGEGAATTVATKAAKQSAIKLMNLNGLWSTTSSMQALAKVMTPEASKLTKEGADALLRFDEKTGPAVSCVPSAPPWSMILPDLKRITMSDDAMVIENEYDNARRTIHLDAATHDGAMPSLQGHSIGKWVGNSFVIDTARFAYHGTGNGGSFAGRLPSSTQKHLVERLTSSEDGRSLTYSFELTDPEFLTETKAASFQWAFNPDGKFVAEPCTLESARRFIKH